MLVLYALLPALAAVANAATEIDILGLEAHFKQSGLGDVFHDFHPKAILTGGFLGAPGKLTPQADTSAQPDLTVDSLDGTTWNSTYTVMLADANIVGTPQTDKPQNLHWLANGAKVVDGKLSLEGATSIRDYAGPGPAEGSGSHRYVFVLYDEGSNFKAPAGFDAKMNEVPSFSLNSYVEQAGLGDLVAANYFNVENGQATVTVTATSPVDTATLSAPAASNSAAASASGTATGSASASAGASAGASGSASAGASASGATKSDAHASSASTAPTHSASSGATKTLPALALGALLAAAVFAF